MTRIAVACAIALGAPATAEAFCGFYVAGSNKDMFNDATQVVLMRKGTRTVLSMQNNYKGPPEAFAMVIPVPVVLKEADVKTLTKDVFQHVEQMGAPRLVEYWEQDPCGGGHEKEESRKMARASAAPSPGMADAKAKDHGVTIEAKFTVGEYNILILSAKDSTGLESWLVAEKYQIPKDAAPLLRPYVEQGMKFFVAKVDPQKVKFENDANGTPRAELSPLRFHYDSEEFALPIRLGLANSSGTQDLIVNILAPQKRYEVSNYKNVMIPTNIDVSPAMKEKFGAFYTALFDRTIEKNPGAVVTEYAWQATTCDPCPGPALGWQEFQILGADVLEGTQAQPTAYRNADFVLTRLHARYGKSISDDLRFKDAPPIVGGREHLQSDGKIEEGYQTSTVNNFQGRYAIRHRWTGPLACASPVRGRWGGPPAEVASRPGFQYTGVKPAVDIALAPRGGIDLPKVVRRDVPELDLKAVGATIATPTPTTPADPAKPAPDTKPFTPREPQKTGCGCDAGAEPGAFALFGLLALGFVTRRRRR
ncbi:MAG TPA: DUF2330 domain-containing protein [Kofleriaceae bacterium]